MTSIGSGTTWRARALTALAIALPLLLCSSCETLRTMEFYVDAINGKEEQVPCAILLEDRLVLGDDNVPLLTPNVVTVDFLPRSRSRRDRGGVKLGVRPVEVDPDGIIMRGVQGEEMRYVEDTRTIRRDDAARQLFILRRNNSFVE